ncbi:OLC1v1012151C1 [Oldenlandia corymbosa var. corymbosa]|uniref:OLC1v1012151C1 n=1 Tax=Oldenlandia corymbosa var. corymbosa TaxID=529605 RepID=A0AAV1DYQ1_OLDCO|nr:OLC1v1012151C1 [Oldenlandia corymbosa var. corymbosa]
MPKLLKRNKDGAGVPTDVAAEKIDKKLASCSSSSASSKTQKQNAHPGGTVDLPDGVPEDSVLKGGSEAVVVPVDQGASGTSPILFATPEGAIRWSHPSLDTAPLPYLKWGKADKRKRIAEVRLGNSHKKCKPVALPPKVQTAENHLTICPNPTAAEKGLEVCSGLSGAELLSEIQSRVPRFKEQGRPAQKGVIELASRLQEMETAQNEALKMCDDLRGKIQEQWKKNASDLKAQENCMLQLRGECAKLKGERGVFLRTLIKKFLESYGFMQLLGKLTNPILAFGRHQAVERLSSVQNLPHCFMRGFDMSAEERLNYTIISIIKDPNCKFPLIEYLAGLSEPLSLEELENLEEDHNVEMDNVPTAPPDNDDAVLFDTECFQRAAMEKLEVSSEVTKFPWKRVVELEAKLQDMETAHNETQKTFDDLRGKMEERTAELKAREDRIVELEEECAKLKGERGPYLRTLIRKFLQSKGFSKCLRGLDRSAEERQNYTFVSRIQDENLEFPLIEYLAGRSDALSLEELENLKEDQNVDMDSVPTAAMDDENAVPFDMEDDAECVQQDAMEGFEVSTKEDRVISPVVSLARDDSPFDEDENAYEWESESEQQVESDLPDVIILGWKNTTKARPGPTEKLQEPCDYSLITIKWQEEEIKRLESLIEGARATAKYWNDEAVISHAEIEELKKTLEDSSEEIDHLENLIEGARAAAKYWKDEAVISQAEVEELKKKIEDDYENLCEEEEKRGELEAQLEQLYSDRRFLMVEGIPMVARKLLQSDEVHQILRQLCKEVRVKAEAKAAHKLRKKYFPQVLMAELPFCYNGNFKAKMENIYKQLVEKKYKYLEDIASNPDISIENFQKLESQKPSSRVHGGMENEVPPPPPPAEYWWNYNDGWLMLKD